MNVVLHIIERLSDYGGTPRKLLMLAQHLNANDCKQIFYCYFPSDLQGHFQKEGAIVEILHGTSLLEIYRNAIFLIKKYNVTAVYTHFTRPLIAGYLAAKTTGIPISHCEHSSANYRTGFGRLCAKFILPRVQSIICNSTYTKRSVAEAFHVAENKMLVIYNPVIPRKHECAPSDTRKMLEIPEHSFVIGHIGGMIEQRDQATLINAFAKTKASIGNAILLLIGDGPKRIDLESLVARLGLGESVRFLGYTDRVGDCLHVMDIYINPTLDEGFGIAVVEAMLAGLPVVLSDRGAHPELVEDGISGFLYCGGDAVALSSTIEHLAASAELRTAIGNAALNRAASHFSPEQYSKEFLAHTKNTVETYKASSPARRRKGWRWNIPF